jgi:antirestriction protein ArdC
MNVQELYARVTQNIISEIEAGNLPPWLKPWKQGRRTGAREIDHQSGASDMGAGNGWLHVSRRSGKAQD